MNQTKENHGITIPTKPFVALIVALVSIVFAQEASACAAFNCLASKDFQAQGLSSEPGLTVGLSYDYINQDRQTIGKNSSVTTIELLNSNPNLYEVKHRITTALTTLSVNYNKTDLGVELQLPYVARTLETFNSALNAPNPPLNISQSNSMGDARVIGRFSGSDDNSFGLNVGLKLPTGATDATMSDGVTLFDRSLQPGTGSTDMLVGAYKSGQSDKFGWFVQAMYQTALSTKSDVNNGGTYKPGDSKSINIGMRYATFGNKIIPMLQLNMSSRLSDTGTAATPMITGGELIYLTPGVTARLWGGAMGFIFLQLPVFQDVTATDVSRPLESGSQLTAQRILSLGIKHTF